MDLEEIGINTRNWVDSAQDRDYWRALVNAALNLRVPQAMELVIDVKTIEFFLIIVMSHSLTLVFFCINARIIYINYKVIQ